MNYHADKRLSASGIELFRRDRRDYYSRVIEDKAAPPPTEAMSFGSYVHALVLEPDTVGSRFVFPPRRHDLDPELFGTDEGAKQVDRRTKAGKDAWRDFMASVGDRLVVPIALADLAPGMLRALGAHEEAGPLLFGEGGINEHKLAWTCPETGRDMRGTPDRLLDGVIVELKTDQCIEPTTGTAWRWYEAGYHRKAAVYLDGLYELTGRNHVFRYVFVETSNRPRVAVWTLETDSPAVMVGRDEYQETIRQIQECEQSGEWRAPWERGQTDYPLPGPVLARAEFMIGKREEVALTMGGERISI